MDRELSSDFKKKKKVKTYFILFSIFIVFVLCVWSFRSFIKPKISRTDFKTSRASVRTIEGTITASGTVIPEYEEAITSPIDAKVEKVFHSAGEKVKEGQSIIQLNKEFTLISFEKLNDELKIKRNKIQQLKLALEKTLIDLEVQLDIKHLKLKSLETALEQEIKLKNIGGTSGESLEKAELDVKIAKYELEQIKNLILNQKRLISADLKAQGFEISIQQKNIKELQRKMDQAEVKASRDGVITYVKNNIGSSIKAGDVIAQLADLNNFKIEGKISDEYVDNLRVGGPIIVKVNDSAIRGRVSNIEPQVEKGIVKFIITLDDKNHKVLRSNMQVDVFVVSSFKDKAISVKNGAGFSGSKEQKVFVIENGKAVGKTVKIGSSNFDYVEIIDGVKAGDEVIVSDMTDYLQYDEFTVN